MATTMPMLSTPYSSSTTSAAALVRTPSTSSLHGFLPRRKADNKRVPARLLLTLSKPTEKQNCRTSIQASYSTGDRTNSASVFVGGFILGGIIVGALGAMYAPQITILLAGKKRRELMRKLPKFIYDEEKALEETRKILTRKIAHLNSAIDDFSSQFKPEDGTSRAPNSTDEAEAAI